jgi:bifunctional non-homologous end joining protein LigD
VEGLHLRSCLTDGEAIAFEADGLASFELLRGRRHDRQATLCAFDLLELDGQDLRRDPLERRKAMLAQLVRKSLPGLVLNAMFAEPGDVVFKHGCALGCEGIVSKRLGSRYRSGRTRDWMKVKNPAEPAVKREAEEEWGKERPL